MALTTEQIEELTDQGLDAGKPITVVTYYLSDYGEQILNTIASRILERYGRPDLLDIVYTSLKELVMNAAKANLKRALIIEHGIDASTEEGYARLMKLFKENLPEQKIRKFKRKFKRLDFPIRVTFYCDPGRALKMKIKNNFVLLPQEEERVRQKFDVARKYDDLMQFYLDHGDETEGAGMGITLVSILTSQAGIPRRNFSIYGEPRYNETIARLEIPLVDDYESRRDRFERARGEQSAEEFRSGRRTASDARD